ncbi:MAG: quinone-dependent dihydroorotate dehydrogenase [Verrucomicrobiales bacterium]|jgi:dihydroorotate dehydrogenase|nr:quinone-dependent dihydroorotate dehydrogenase [Verrucomicrobiales bacterium]
MLDLYPLARRLLFAMDAESAHHATLTMMRTADSLGLLAALTGSRPGRNPVALMGLTFPNRVGLAAGMDKTGNAVHAFGELGFGHVEIGTVTPRPQPGNEKPRIFRLKEHGAIINRMGFNNPGIKGMLENLTHSRKNFSGILGINIGKNFDTPNEEAIRDYLLGFEGVYGAADYVTANLSSPNTKGLRDLQNAETCRALIGQLQAKRTELQATHGGKYVPIVIKIAPDLSEEAIEALAGVFSETGVDGIITTNTTIDRDAVAGHALAGEGGGLSGTPLIGKSTLVLKRLREKLDASIPVIGSGGVMSADDAKAKFDAGAALVQVYTGLVYRGPKLIQEIAALS